MNRSKTESKRTGGFDRFLNGIEKVGNKIPDPMVLFVGLCIITLLLSCILSAFGFSDIHPNTGEVLGVYNLFSKEGVAKIINSAVNNFATNPAVSMVLCCMLGVGISEKSGFFSVGLRELTKKATGSDIVVISIFLFVCAEADMTGGVGYVVMPPLGALLWKAMGRNPLAGMFAAYGVTAGAFCSNLILTSMDVINAGFTQAAAQLLDKSVEVSPAVNWYISAVCTIALLITGVLVTVKIIEPRLGEYKGNAQVSFDMSEFSDDAKALKYAGIGILVYIIVLLAGAIPGNGVLRDAQTGSLIASSAPLMKGMALLIMLLFFIPGTIFGFVSKRFKSGKDLIDALGKSMADMGPYIALMFLVAQFMSWFDWSNIGIILAIKGSNALKVSGLPVWLVYLLFITMTATLNMLIGSASAKWAILSSVFVPMFMLLGYSPALTQFAYRIGDAVTNTICPTLAYFAMLLAYAKQYDKNMGVGQMWASLLPYTLAYYVSMLLIFFIFFFLKLPLGPGAGVLWN